MKRNEIEKAAKEYADRKWVIGDRAVNEDGFRAGVAWVKGSYLADAIEALEDIRREAHYAPKPCYVYMADRAIKTLEELNEFDAEVDKN